MSEEYFAECQCGRLMPVELFEAGTSKLCPACNSTIRVPSSTKLKELAGDKYPLLSPIEKIRVTAEKREAPFEGHCHVCRDANAIYQVPIDLNVMVERQVDHEGGVGVTMTRGLHLVAAGGEELWQSTQFPLLLCDACHRQFQSAQFWALIKKWIKEICLCVLLYLFLYFIYVDAAAVAALAGLLWLVGAVAWALKFRDSKKLSPFILRWLGRIRWVPEAIAAEDEYKLAIGKSQPIQPRGG